MLLLVTGSSGSGKTTAVDCCRDLPQLSVHDQDEDGVPSNADVAWRQRSLQGWVDRAAGQADNGIDLLLTTQSPLGELLAAPSTPMLDAYAVLLMDVEPRERLRRLEARDPGGWSPTAQESIVAWGSWHRRHATDPSYRPDVITSGSWSQMQWERWSDWQPCDHRWRVDVLDTTGLDPDRAGAALRSWVVATRCVPKRPSRHDLPGPTVET